MKYNDEEKELIDYVEAQQPESVPNVAQEISRYQSIAHTQITKKKAISIRLLEDDLDGIKARALYEGLPYQTLISSVIHKYLKGELRPA